MNTIIGSSRFRRVRQLDMYRIPLRKSECKNKRKIEKKLPLLPSRSRYTMTRWQRLVTRQQPVHVSLFTIRRPKPCANVEHTRHSFAFRAERRYGRRVTELTLKSGLYRKTRSTKIIRFYSLGSFVTIARRICKRKRRLVLIAIRYRNPIGFIPWKIEYLDQTEYICEQQTLLLRQRHQNRIGTDKRADSTE